MKLMEFKLKLINILKNSKSLKPKLKLKTTKPKNLNVTKQQKTLGKFPKVKAMMIRRVT
jgi:hypothetical protein